MPSNKNSFKLLKAISKNHPLSEQYSPLVAQLLLNRGIETLNEAKSFLDPQWEDNHDPFLMKNIQEGVDRLKEAIDQQQKISIYADYDADGIPGAVVLSSLLDKIGYHNYEVYLPHRHNEGYGIHIEALEKIKDGGTELIITIDVGITAHEAALWTKANKIDMIITDHHEPMIATDGSQNLPDSFLLINPKQEKCSYPDDMLCGCGVIFKLVQAFINLHGQEYKISEGWEKWLLDMVGLSTISDMVPLVKENRLFASFGMRVIPKTKRLGLKKLIWDAGLDMRYITEEDLAFSVTPKLNAASRMSHPEDAFSALIAKNDLEATTRVKHLDEINNERKKLVAQTMKTALSRLKERPVGSVIIIGSADWQAGILGLVASKLVEHYKVPAFVWSQEKDDKGNISIKGSCRTYDGINLVKLMSLAEDNSFIQFGGHAEAGGFSCEKNEIHFLQERLDTAYSNYEKSNGKPEKQRQEVDMELELKDVSLENYKGLRKLAPFGQGNSKPLFLFKKIVPHAIEHFGKEKNHLKLWFTSEDGREISAIKFFATAASFGVEIKEFKALTLLAHMDYSVFRGRHELRLSIVDIL